MSEREGHKWRARNERAGYVRRAGGMRQARDTNAAKLPKQKPGRESKAEKKFLQRRGVKNAKTLATYGD